ncbi:MAG: hypothetical protein DRJ43_03970 [Thermoprotei archaeon]|nr:MAG: hypothetical protein DRJ43_03970 [Thermoprotei archaeon]
MIKVLQITTNLEIGGVPYHILNICRYIRRDRFKLYLLCVLGMGRLLIDFLKIKVPVFLVNIDKGPPYQTFQWIKPLPISKICKVIKREEINIVQTHLWPASTMGRIAGGIMKTLKRHDIAIIDTLHNVYTWKRGKHVFMNRLLSKFTDKIVCVSNAVKNFAVKYEKIPEDKCIVIYNGLDLDRLKVTVHKNYVKQVLEIPQNRTVIGYAGRLVKVKNLDILVKAMKIVAKKIPNCHLLIIGEGPFKEKLYYLAYKLSLTGKCTFLPFVEHLANFLNVIDIFVLPSSQEGFSIVAAEAQALGKPVIASKVGGLPEVIINGVTGILINDITPKKLAAAIYYLLKHEDIRIEMGRKAKARALNLFDMKNIIRQLENLYLTLIKR